MSDITREAVPAPKVMHEDAPAAIIGEIGNQIHNLGCEMQNDEDVSLRLSDLAIRLWDAAKLFSTEPVTPADTRADLADALAAALRGAIGALEFSRDYHADLGNEDQAFAQDKLDDANAALAAWEGRK